MDFPPWETVYGWFRQWKTRGVTERILDELREQVRLAEGRDAEPSAGVIDPQSVKEADTVRGDSRGLTRAKGQRAKRCIVIDTLGVLVSVTVLAASWQDRDGAKTALLGVSCSRRSGTCSPIRASPAGWWTGPLARCRW